MGEKNPMLVSEEEATKMIEKKRCSKTVAGDICFDKKREMLVCFVYQQADGSGHWWHLRLSERYAELLA